MSRGTWERIKPPEYYSATDFERAQWACGVPPRYWDSKLSSINPASAVYSFKGKRERIAPTVQNQYLKDRVENPEILKSNRFACLSSSPTDEHAMAAACALVNAYVAKAWEADLPLKVRVDDVQDYEECLKVGKVFYSVTPDILVLYNLDDNSSKERLSLVKDVIKRFEGIYRAVVATSDSPLGFARNKLYCEPQEVYYFEGLPRKVVSR